jgi:arylsulfatase A-like enzyme
MRPPTILLITCHDIGRHLGAYGVKTVHTPNLDRLAHSGVLFERAFTVSPSCSPSRAALATGRYPHANGVMGLAHPPFSWSLNVGERHLAEVLRSAGYDTHLFGLQHVTLHPEALGFSQLHGFDLVRGCHEPALGRRVAEEFEAFCGELADDGPAYIEINLEEPHRPYDQGGSVPDTTAGVYIPPYLPDDAASYEDVSALQGAIRQADNAVGRILRAAEAGAMSNNLLIVFSADHGLAMPRAKCTLYDPGLETALLMKWQAGGWGSGRTISSMISNVDIFPTLVEAVGVEVPENVQGVSFFPALQERAFAPRAAIFAEKTYHTYYDPMRAVRTSAFKYIRNFERTPSVEVPTDVQAGPIFRADPNRFTDPQHEPVELYDLEQDPWEGVNLAGHPAYRETENELHAELSRWTEETHDPLLRGWVPSPEAESEALTAR